MNNKVSNIQMGMFLALLICSMYLGINDIILLRKAKSAVLIAMFIGAIIGLIPILIYLKINSTMPNLNIFEKNKKLFGNTIGNIINFILILFFFSMLAISIRSIVIFVTSKYLNSTPYYLVGILVLITTFIVAFNEIENILRVSQITFIASLIFMIIIELFIIKYVRIDNILPIIINNNIKDILKTAIYHASTTSLLTILLLPINKQKVNNPKKYNKTIILFYLFSSLTLIIVMFLLTSCFGYKMSTLFRYPEYIILKKIGISNGELHLENLLAFRWIIYMLALGFASFYGIKTGINTFTKNKKIINKVAIIVSIIAMIMSKIIFRSIPHSIILIKDYYISFLAIPVFILILLIYFKCLNYKEDN